MMQDASPVAFERKAKLYDFALSTALEVIRRRLASQIGARIHIRFRN